MFSVRRKKMALRFGRRPNNGVDTKKKKRAWQEDQQEGSKKQRESEAMAKLKRELSEKERLAEKRLKEMEEFEKTLERTRGEVTEENWGSVGMVVFLEVELGSKKKKADKKTKGFFVMELFEDMAPKAAKTFYNLLTSGNLKTLSVDKCLIIEVPEAERSRHLAEDSETRRSLKHTNAGVLSLCQGKNPHFQILFTERPDLDGKQTVFGKLIHGFALLRAIEDTDSLTVVDAGRVTKKHTLKETLDALAGNNQSLFVLHNDTTDEPKELARTYRNKTNYYDSSARSALFSWTTSC